MLAQEGLHSGEGFGTFLFGIKKVGTVFLFQVTDIHTTAFERVIKISRLFIRNPGIFDSMDQLPRSFNGVQM